MDHFQVRTSGGTFGFLGQLHCDRARPTLVAINGSFPTPDHLHDLVTDFPGANILIAYLPGMGPPWTPTDVPRLTAGFSEALDRLCGDLPLVVYGASTGNLVALGLQRPTIVRKLATEPFFTTAQLWPFIGWARRWMARSPTATDQRAYLATLFGIGADGSQEDRDYGYLLDGLTVPLEVLVGAIPLGEQRDMNGWPSLTSEEDRARLLANPLVTLHVGAEGTGHAVDVYDPGKTFMRRRMHAALLEAAKHCR